METSSDGMSQGERVLLRHTLATLAYRAEKVLRDVPSGFPEHRLAARARTPLQIVGHLADLMEWAVRMAQSEMKWKPSSLGDWDGDVARFYAAAAALDQHLASDATLAHPPAVIFQGPIADALTHIGQLAMLRGLAGMPVRPESYARAQIVAGRVGTDQASERREFDGDASRREP